MIERIAGRGWLALIGGGEFSFEETEQADAGWLAKSAPGAVAFLPTASGSDDYGRHFAVYLDEYFERPSELVPVYRPRDARRGKNAERLAEAPAVYVGGGISENLLDTLGDSPCLGALRAKLEQGGVVAAIASAAQATGMLVRSLRGGRLLPGFGWLPGGFVEPNFEPAHDRRLRDALRRSQVRWGVGIPAGSALLLGPEGEVEVIGLAFVLNDAEADFEVLSSPTS